ncbi:MAG: TlpA disulfide reductase family protein [Dehalococcoidia bacterium]
MAGTKAKRKPKAPTPFSTRVRRWVRKHTTLIGFLVAVPIVAGLIIFFTDPFSTPTAIDADGSEVETGVIPTEGAAPRERRPAPNFVLADYEGQAVRLSDFRGKTVLVNFWATWCTTCEAEMSDMQRLAAENPDDLVVLAVNQAEGRGRAKAWSDARGLTALIFVLDSREDVTSAYKLPSGLPHSFFIDANGVVRVVKHGGMRFEEMDQLLEETRVAATSARGP